MHSLHALHLQQFFRLLVMLNDNFEDIFHEWTRSGLHAPPQPDGAQTISPHLDVLSLPGRFHWKSRVTDIA